MHSGSVIIFFKFDGLQNDSEALLGCLLNLKLLGKFLGLLTFLPYQTNDAPLTEEMQQMHLMIRNQVWTYLIALPLSILI
jgi:hypothetical protein